MTQFQLEVTVRSPLHIGSGGPLLRRGVDFMSAGRFLYMLDLDRVLDYILPEDDAARVDEIIRSQNLASFLTPTDLDRHPELYLYRVGGSASVSEVREQLKDVHARPYVPGSTLKGMIRTALATTLASQREVPLTLAQLGPRAEWAARELEQDLFGRAPRPAQAPNYDLMRTIQITDSGPGPVTAMELENVIVWPAGQRGIPIDVEAIKPGVTFQMRLKLDEYLLGQAARELQFGRNVELLRDWLRVAQEHGLAQIRQEQKFFSERRAPAVERFYGDLLREAEQRREGVFFAQLGWGAGWHSKTLSRIIQPNRELLAAIIQRYRMGRGNVHPDAPFPKTRHLIADRGQPLLPLGWVQVQVAT